MHAFGVPQRKLHELVKHFVKEMDQGLARDDQDLKMIPSFVTVLPRGTETGVFLGKRVQVPSELKTGRGVDLFDFFAACVQEFLAEIDATTPAAPAERLLGLTFSFPVAQTAIDKGTLMQWCNGYTASGVEGSDPVQMLQAALDRKRLRVRVVALVNDAVGTLVAHAFKDTSTHLGVILGTGTNAAYVERIDRIPKYAGHLPPSSSSSSSAAAAPSQSSGLMVVNTEWGAFDDACIVLPVTQYDLTIDRQSSNPRTYMLEKLVGGMYLAELLRLVLADLVSTGELFGGAQVPALSTRGSIETALLSRIERDHSADLADVRNVLENLVGVPRASTTIVDRRVVKRVAELIGTRSARLVAAGIAAIVTRTHRLNDCTVAIDGSLYENYPHYANRVRDALREIVGVAADNILLVSAHDGSSLGAALVAALIAQ
nr:hexokinase A [Polyrhizophydium stewartii]